MTVGLGMGAAAELTKRSLGLKTVGKEVLNCNTFKILMKEKWSCNTFTMLLELINGAYYFITSNQVQACVTLIDL